MSSIDRYDFDKLEVRFYELFEIVDVFVIYEATRTQSGLHKPLYFDMVRHLPLYRQWQEKIIYIQGLSRDDNLSVRDTLTRCRWMLPGTEEELAGFHQETLQGIATRNFKKSWALERSMRSEPIRR
jgi:Glycosyltransferase family 17